MKTRIQIIFLFSFIFLISCGHDREKPTAVYGEEIVIKRYDDSTKMIVIQYKKVDTTYAFKTYFYRNGKTYMSGELHNGFRNGVWSAWDENGNLLTNGTYVDGVDQGLKTVYYLNGNKRYEGQMKSNKRVGVWKFWDEKGKFLKEIDYGELGSLKE